MGLVAFTFVAILAIVEYRREPRPFPSVSELYDINRPVPPAPLAPERRVMEQDCSKPLEDPGANLKCR